MFDLRVSRTRRKFFAFISKISSSRVKTSDMDFMIIIDEKILIETGPTDKHSAGISCLVGISLFQQFVKAAYQTFITCIQNCSQYCRYVIAGNNVVGQKLQHGIIKNPPVVIANYILPRNSSFEAVGR